MQAMKAKACLQASLGIKSRIKKGGMTMNGLFFMNAFHNITRAF